MRRTQGAEGNPARARLDQIGAFFQLQRVNARHGGENGGGHFAPMMDSVSHSGYIKHEVPINMKRVAATERYGRGAWRPPENTQEDVAAVFRVDGLLSGLIKESKCGGKHKTAKDSHHLLVLIVG